MTAQEKTDVIISHSFNKEPDMKKRPKIIGITGKAQAGKDTIANFLNGVWSYQKFAFADELKTISDILFGLSGHEQKSTYLKRWDMTKRELLQKVGSKMREVHPDVWVYKVMQLIQLTNIFKTQTYVVIPDVRYPNEIDVIKKQNGKLIKIVRTNFKSPLSLKEQTHLSETALDNIPDSEYDLIVIAESGNLESIYVQVQDWLVSICME